MLGVRFAISYLFYFFIILIILLCNLLGIIQKIMYFVLPKHFCSWQQAGEVVWAISVCNLKLSLKPSIHSNVDRQDGKGSSAYW